MLASALAAAAKGATVFMPLCLSTLALAQAEIGNFDDAWRSIGEDITAVETSGEWWCEAEVHRRAGEITLLSPEPIPSKAVKNYFNASAKAGLNKPRSVSAPTSEEIHQRRDPMAAASVSRQQF